MNKQMEDLNFKKCFKNRTKSLIWSYLNHIDILLSGNPSLSHYVSEISLSSIDASK